MAPASKRPDRFSAESARDELAARPVWPWASGRHPDQLSLPDHPSDVYASANAPLWKAHLRAGGAATRWPKSRRGHLVGEAHVQFLGAE